MSEPDVTREFGRLLTAMVTPFDAAGALDLASAQRLAAYLVDRGCDGLVVSGTTGETPTTSAAEQDALLRAVVEAVGDRARVVAGVGSNDTAHTIESAQAAQKAGAHALLVVTPYYNRPPQSGVLAHFQAVADNGELPVMLYDIPGRTGTPISYDTLLRLGEHPRILAVKDAKGDLFQGARVMDRTDLAYFSGDDLLNLPWLAAGASGLVSVVSHVAADRYAALLDAVAAGDLATARAVNAQLLPAVEAIMTRTQGAIAVKAALQLLGIIPSRQTRLPLLPATDEEVAGVRADLERTGLL